MGSFRASTSYGHQDFEPSAPPYPHLNHVQLKVDDFHGEINSLIFCDWVHSLESYFEWHDLPEDLKLSFVKSKLKGTARAWWENYQRTPNPAIITWCNMKSAMSSQFLLPNYKQRAWSELTKLVQGTKTVDEYTNVFHSLALTAEFPMVDHVMVPMYLEGLNPLISNHLRGIGLDKLPDVVIIAKQLEDAFRKPNSTDTGKSVDNMKKVKLRLGIHDENDEGKVLKIVSHLPGVQTKRFNMRKKKLRVTGYIDILALVIALQEFWETEILAVGPAKEPKKEKHKIDRGKKEQRERRKENGKKKHQKQQCC